MPRLAPRFVAAARREHPHLATLLRECRDLPSARNELRWLRAHAKERVTAKAPPSALPVTQDRKRRRVSQTRFPPGWRTLLADLVQRRAYGEPLQYLIGDAPFGPLEMLCRKGVLIPRDDTEAWVSRFVDTLTETKRYILDDKAENEPIRVLDLCTGSGCIALLAHKLLSEHYPRRDFHTTGQDISPAALRFANQNLWHNIEKGLLPSSAATHVKFGYGDVLNPVSIEKDTSSQPVDIIFSNPPYVAPAEYDPNSLHNNTDATPPIATSRSVRRFEPKLALVPPSFSDGRLFRSLGLERGDEFYLAIFQTAVDSSAKVIALEVGGTKQAERVGKCAVEFFGRHDGKEMVDVEVLRDDGTMVYVKEVSHSWHIADAGLSHCRAVVIWRRRRKS